MNDFEEELCKRINERIKVRGYCIVYNKELTHICAPESGLRKKQIELVEKQESKS